MLDRENIMTMRSAVRLLASGAAVAAMIGLSAPGFSAELPKTTRTMLKDLKLDASVLKGIEQELKIPNSWVKKSKKEGTLRVISTGFEPKIFRKFTRPFRERYPWIKFSYTRSSYHARVVKTLISFKEGRVVTDIITNFTGSHADYKKAGLLVNLRDIPNFNNAAQWNDKDGLWAAQRLRHFCMVINNKKWKKKDMPKTWEDIIKDTRWHNGKLAIANRPHIWLEQLGGVKGEQWALNFMNDLFGKVKPQVRKEGLSALMALAIVGEFDASLPGSPARTKSYVDKGAPLTWHCPEPVPSTVTELGIVKGTPQLYTSKIYLNWYLSLEGQVAQWYSVQSAPVHKDLQKYGFHAFPNEIKGKKLAFGISDLMQSTSSVHSVWGQHWLKIAGPVAKMKTVTGKVTAVKRGGRRLFFTVGGKKSKAKISGRRTRVKIGGKDDVRKNIKPGMTCKITYPGSGEEAKLVDCKV